MSKRNLTNVAASVHARLINRSRESGEDFQFLLQRYAAERFLYGLGVSSHRDRFVLKGAMLFALWGGSVYRATRDLDFTGYGDPSEEAVRQCFREICTQPVEDDGLAFDASTIRVEPILDEAEYNGVRVRFEARLGGARIPMQVDVGFGNAIEPAARDEEYPTLLDGPAPRIRAYPVEAVVAEKLHAIYRFGETNSRLKDFYDLYVLSEQFDFDAELLQRAVAATFERRATPIDSTLPAGLQPRFFADDARAGQWRAYLSRNGLPGAPADFQVISERLRAFLGPIWNGIANGSPANGTWRHGNGWRFGETDSGAATVPGTAVESITQVTAPVVSTAKDAVAATSTSPIERPATTGLGRFKPYPAYKDSGVEWLGEIPAHWEVKRLRFLFRIVNGSTPATGTPGYWDGDIPWVTPDDLGELSKPFIESTRRSITEAGYKSCGVTLVPPGSLVLSTRAPIGHLGIAAVELCTNQGCRGLVLRREASEKFFFYHLLSAKPELEARGQGSTFRELSTENLASVSVAFPPVPEQRAIAAFLDRETARIDALVEKKERLIALLQEKRTALISQAVTKGLDPTVPMKESGVEWLGAIPAHWEVKKLAWLTACLDGRRVPLNAEERSRMQGEYPYWGASSIVDYVDKWLFDEELVLLGEDGAPFFDRTKPVAFRVCGKVWVNNHAHVLRPGRQVDAAFLAYVLNCVDYSAFIDGTTRDKLTQADMNAIPIQCPGRPEQRAIAAFLDRETAKIDALIAKVREAIERLKEYRTALISAAVTGKIDVREAVSA
jgi:type I restriction enzyme S subunit